MSCADFTVFFITQAGLVLAAIACAAMDLRNSSLSKRAEAIASATRGEPSMNALYTFYGIVTVVYSLVVDAAAGIDAYKVSLIVLDYVCLTYLFFFSSWFRNMCFFPTLRRVRKD